MTAAPTDSLTDTRWSVVERAQAGDGQAFAELYDRYRTPVFRFIYRRVTDRDLAADLTQDTFVKAIRNIGNLHWQGTDPGAWFTTIARNLVADHYKSARVRLASNVPPEWWTGDEERQGGLAQHYPDPGPTPEQAAVTAATRAAVHAAIQQLPAKQRTVIELRYLADLTVEETCARTGLTDGAVKALTYRAVRALARIMPRTTVEAAA